VLLGLALSLPLHAGVAAWLATMRLEAPGRPDAGGVLLDLAVVPEEDLDTSPAGAEGARTDSPAVETAASAPMQGTDAGPLAAEAGEGSGLAEGGAAGFSAGGGSGGALGGGSGATSFFGVGGTGQRFAFIVDKSGSMARHMEEAKAELRRSIASLPDYASICVVFFDSGEPIPFSDRWERVRPATLNRLARWLRDIGPSGGTEPTRAFRRVFQMDARPDVVFFLSDGEIPQESVAEIRRMNSLGRRVTVHSIAFGEDAGSARLRQVAQDAGGEYRHVMPKGRAR
jgi:hypothetical protein